MKLNSKEIDERLKNGPEMVSAKFVIPYPPGFPIMVPGQVITPETITFMRKLDVKEIHGYNAALGLELLKPEALAACKSARQTADQARKGALSHGSRSSTGSPPTRTSCCSSWSAARCWSASSPIKGYGLGMVAAAIVVGAGLSAWASTYGVKMKLDNFAKSLFYYLFMYGVGLRVGPSFINSLKGDGLKFIIPRGVLLGPGPARRGVLHEVFGPARRRRRRHPRRRDDHVGGDRLGRGGGAGRACSSSPRARPPSR